MWNGSSLPYHTTAARPPSSAVSAPNLMNPNYMQQSTPGSRMNSGLAGLSVAVDATWEDIFDSGQLEQRFHHHLSMQPVPPPITTTSSSPYPPPLMSIITHPPSVSSGPPARIALHPTRTGPVVSSGYAPGVPKYAQPPPRILKKPPTIPDTSVPPPPPPPRLRVSAPSQTLNNLSPLHQHPFPRSPATYVHVEEDHPRTPYVPPEPKVKILRRPASIPTNLSGSAVNGDLSDSNGIRTKSLKQREEEYAQARLRIMGSAEPVVSDSGSCVKVGNNSVSESTKSSTCKNESPPCNIAFRAPKGPDGSQGFQHYRRS